MPNMGEETRKILRFIAEEVSPQTYVNVMAQYRPMHEAHDYAEIARPITRDEYNDAYLYARSLGLNLP
jgi:putative pyruvate formate lyase activating enzyme